MDGLPHIIMLYRKIFQKCRKSWMKVPLHQKASQTVFSGNYNLFGLYDYQLDVSQLFFRSSTSRPAYEQILNSML
jgi:hypothetical protein